MTNIDPVEPVTPAPADPATPEPAAPAEKTYTQAELNAAAAAARKAHADEIKELQAKAARLEEIEASQMSEADKAARRAEAAEKAKAEAEAELARVKLDSMKTRIGAEKGLDPKLAARLTGTTEEEIAADADAILALIPKSEAPGARPGGEPTTDKLTADLRRAAGLS